MYMELGFNYCKFTIFRYSCVMESAQVTQRVVGK